MNRRKFIKGTIGAGVLGLLTGLYSWQIEPFWLEFVTLDMPIANLPAELEGKTLMQISDLHIGRRISSSYLIDALKKAQTYQPDWVVYTGDFITYDSPKQFDELQAVFQYATKGKYGTVGILGNHDYGYQWKYPKVAEKIVSILEKLQIPILRNEQMEINGLNIIGLDDYWGTNYHPEKVMQNLSHSKANVVLCHNPDVLDEPVWNGYTGWVLAGHTHGGQVKPPFLSPFIVPVKNKKYTAGKFDMEDGRTLYINRALGYRWQVRLNVRPEITIFTLKKKTVA